MLILKNSVIGNDGKVERYLARLFRERIVERVSVECSAKV